VRPESVDAIPPKVDAHTQFFLRINPGYLQGHELVCVARIASDNFTEGLKRVMRAGGIDETT
jgi:hypothetical protein